MTALLEELQEELDIPNEIDLIASICRSSFYDFVKEFWSVVSFETPIWNWHIQYICDELQKAAERVFKGLPKLYDIVINVPPGTSKSTICSIMFPAWCWTRMAHCRIIGASYSHSLAQDLSRKGRDVVKSEKYRKCFPEVEIREDQDAKAYFINTKNGDRFAVGVGGSVMGMHGHFLLIDDPIDPLESISAASMKTTHHWMTETIPSRKANKVTAVTIIIMQRLAQDDPTGVRLEKSREVPVLHICLPAELTADVSPPKLKLLYQDGLLDPIRLPRKVLAETMSSLGDFGYAGQFLQNPVPRGGGMFHTNKLVYGIPPDSFKTIVRYWDKATTIGGTFTVGCKMGVDKEGRFWVLDIVRGQWESAKRERVMRQTAEVDGGSVIIGLEQEPGSGGKESAEFSARNLAGFRVRLHKVGKSDGDKEHRADAFSVQVNCGNVSMVRASWNKEYTKEMAYFPFSKYKDQIDASSGAFFFLTRVKIIVGGL